MSCKLLKQKKCSSILFYSILSPYQSLGPIFLKEWQPSVLHLMFKPLHPSIQTTWPPRASKRLAGMQNGRKKKLGDVLLSARLPKFVQGTIPQETLGC